MPTTIHIAQTEAEKQAIYRFRYQIYIEELGKKLEFADHFHQSLQEPIDECAALFYATSEDQIIATCRVVFGCDATIPTEWHDNFQLAKFESYDCRSFAVVSRLMIARRFRGSSATNDILLETYKIARQKRIQFAFAHCRPQLVPLYLNMGWRTYNEPFEDLIAGLKVPIVLVLEDEAHLRSSDSIFLPESLRWPNNPGVARWFAEFFSPRELLTA